MASSRVGGEGGIALAQGLSAGALLPEFFLTARTVACLQSIHAPHPNAVWSTSRSKTSSGNFLSRVCYKYSHLKEQLTLSGLSANVPYRTHVLLPLQGRDHLRLSGPLPGMSAGMSRNGFMCLRVHARCWYVQAAAW